jgi:hypothetical protein
MQSLYAALLYGSTPEYFPAPYRGSASGFAATLGRIAGIVAPLIAQTIFSAQSNSVLYLAGGVCLSFPSSSTQGSKGPDSSPRALSHLGCPDVDALRLDDPHRDSRQADLLKFQPPNTLPYQCRLLPICRLTYLSSSTFTLIFGPRPIRLAFYFLSRILSHVRSVCLSLPSFSLKRLSL